MKAKILTWDEFREVCKIDAYNWINSGYSADEPTEKDIISEYPEEYFDSDTDCDVDELSHCFTPHEFYKETIEYIRELQGGN